ncbi:hypothetical protein LIER_37888 [Lithospermum erythrorhizon]|uniref:K-box domain-containing protein n=1 Tax=Lithospermum erythrorhizon TaxID=34254 RepID=A0AAV3PRV4_LITER
MYVSKILDRYEKSTKNPGIGNKTEENIQRQKEEADKLRKTIELVEHSKRKLLGDCLDSCSADELQELEKQLERSLLNIRARKSKMFREQIDKLKQEVNLWPFIYEIFILPSFTP